MAEEKQEPKVQERGYYTIVFKKDRIEKQKLKDLKKEWKSGNKKLVD